MGATYALLYVYSRLQRMYFKKPSQRLVFVRYFKFLSSDFPKSFIDLHLFVIKIPVQTPIFPLKSLLTIVIAQDSRILRMNRCLLRGRLDAVSIFRTAPLLDNGQKPSFAIVAAICQKSLVRLFTMRYIEETRRASCLIRTAPLFRENRNVQFAMP